MSAHRFFTLLTSLPEDSAWVRFASDEKNYFAATLI